MKNPVATVFMLVLLTVGFSPDSHSNPVFPPDAFDSYWTANAGWMAVKGGGIIQLTGVTTYGKTPPTDRFATTLMLAGKKCFLIQDVDRSAQASIVFVPNESLTDNECPPIVKDMQVTASGRHQMQFELRSAKETLASGAMTNSGQFGATLNYSNPSRRHSQPRMPIKNYTPPEVVALAEAVQTKQRKRVEQRIAAVGLPESLEGHYIVAKSGLITQLSLNRFYEYEAVIHTPDQFNIEAGRSRGDTVFKFKQDTIERFKVQDALIITSQLKNSYRHCTKTIFSAKYNIGIKRLVRPDGTAAPDSWALRHIGGGCDLPIVSRSRCTFVRCEQGRPNSPKGKADAVLLKSLPQAQQLSQARAASFAGESYADAQQRANQYGTKVERTRPESSRSSGKRTPGYFERGGACGAISCDEADTNQFILDEVFLN